jgi:hypothetical protein
LGLNGDLTEFYPISGHEKINGVVYDWQFENRGLGKLKLSVDGSHLRPAQFNEIHEDFREHIVFEALRLKQKGASVSAELTQALETVLGHKIREDQLTAYTQAMRYLLHADSSAFLTFSARLVFDYHALDRELTQTVLLSATRAMYSSPSSALLHIDATGSSGAGKNDLVSRITTLINPKYLELFSTVSPTALQYKTIQRTYDKNGKLLEAVSNKDTFKGKIICITEVADAAGFSALKALAETDEQAEYTHLATVNGVAIDMTITGPRCVIITSVEGVNDDQVKRRFIHGSVSEDTEENKALKLELIERLLKDHKDIQDDPRLAIARAGLDLIFSAQDVVFEEVEETAWALNQELNKLFIKAGYGLTNIKQFYSLCECLALWKRFKRGYTRVDVEDVREAWFLLATFERETITKLSTQGIKTLRAIKALCVEYDNLFELDVGRFSDTAKRPTRREVVKEADVSQAHIYRLLQNKPREQGKCGELIELNYVRDVEYNDHLAVELTPLGETVLGDIPSAAIVNNVVFEPKEPIFGDQVDLNEGMPSVSKILAILTHSQENEKI